MIFSNDEVRADWISVVLDLDNPKKTGENPHFKNKYAPLEEVLPSLQEAFKSKDFVIVQESKYEAGAVFVKTCWLHPKGTVETEWMGTPAKADPQGTVGATTYLRRVQPMMVCGLIAEDDDDGNKGSGKDELLTKIQKAKTLEELTKLFKSLTAADQKKYNQDFKMRKLEIKPEVPDETP
jgi:hypothetical protein